MAVFYTNDNLSDRRHRLYRQLYGARTQRHRRSRGAARQSVDRIPLLAAARRAAGGRLDRRPGPGGEPDPPPQRRRHHPFFGIHHSAGIGRRPARLLPQQHDEHLPSHRRGDRSPRETGDLLVDRGGLLQSATRAGARGRDDRVDLALQVVEANVGNHVARSGQGPRPALRGAALFQRGGRRPCADVGTQ